MRVIAVLILLLTCLIVTPSTPAAAEATQPIKVSITQLRCASPCRNEGLEGAGESAPDFYAKITIGNETFTTPRAPDNQDMVSPSNWFLAQDVSTSVIDLPVSILIMDYDDSTPDDVADASPRPGDATLRFTINMINGVAKGDVTGSLGCATGNGEPGGGVFGDDPQPPVTLCWQIEPQPTTDTDGDGLTDYAERRGLDFDNDKIIDLPLSDYSPDPLRRDLFVEIDWMQNDEPSTAVLNAVEQAFSAAPITNAKTGRTGLSLNLVKNEQVPTVDPLIFDDVRGPGALDDFDDLKLGTKACGDSDTDPAVGHFGTRRERTSPACAQILDFKRHWFRYGMFAHRQASDFTSSGVAELDPGTAITGSNDFAVTLGGWNATMITNVGGREKAEIGTLMYELGHTFGLRHGGGDDVNCKPNYLSVMNYPLQFATATADPDRPLDYSTDALDPLVEDAGLDEQRQLSVPRAGNRRIVYGLGGAIKVGRAHQPIDWSGTGAPFDKNATADINTLTDFKGAQGCVTAVPKQTLNGFDDWDNLAYTFTGSRFFADGVHGDLQELTGEDVLRMTSADLKAAKTVDKADAIPGDQLAYTVTATNKGPATATNVAITDGEETRPVADLPAGESAAEHFTATIPCATADGTKIVNTARVTGKPELDETLGDNTATATTTVHAPVLTLTKTATPSAGAAEPVTFTLTYHNTGSAAATGTTITDVLPQGLYYSQGSAQATRNSDGTTTLRWTPGAVPAGAAATITYTARTSLLATGGTTVTNNATLGYGDAGGCAFADVTAAATSTVTEQPPSRNPWLPTLWQLHRSLRTPELLARVQATDQRFDVSPADGVLSQSEADAALAVSALPYGLLRAQLMATYLNLADRRINASTRILSIGFDTVGDAARYAQRADDLVKQLKATTLLNEVNLGLIERY